MARKLRRRQRINIIQILKKNLLSPKAMIGFVILAIIATCGILVRNYLYNSIDFIIEEVGVKGEGVAGSYLFEELSKIGLGENIFAINIRSIATTIKNDYFEVKDIRVERVFPSKLIFYVDKREAIALMESGHYYYPVDKEGMILRDVKQTLQEGLPVITGIYLNKRDIGTILTSPKFKQALLLFEELSKSDIPESHNITEINAANDRNLSFYIDDGLEIKIGAEEFKKRLGLLKKVLEDPETEPRDIRYIDLRFKDVVIGPK